MTTSETSILSSLLKPNTIVKTPEFLCVIISVMEFYTQRKLTGSIPSVKLNCKIIGPNTSNRFFNDDYYIGQVVDIDESVSFITRNWSLIDEVY